MRIIVDANILFSALIKDSVTRRILLHPSFDFYSPDYVLREIQNHKTLISKKAGIPTDKLDALLTHLLGNVKTVPKSFYEKKIKEADKLIGKYDKKDIQYIAVALYVPKSGIWTNDKHFFKQKKVKIWKTEDLLNLII